MVALARLHPGGGCQPITGLRHPELLSSLVASLRWVQVKEQPTWSTIPEIGGVESFDSSRGFMVNPCNDPLAFKILLVPEVWSPRATLFPFKVHLEIVTIRPCIPRGPKLAKLTLA